MIAPVLFGIASFVMKSRFMKVEDMDFVTGLDRVVADTYDEPPPKNLWEKFWSTIVSTLGPTPPPWGPTPFTFGFTVLGGRKLQSVAAYLPDSFLSRVT